MKKIIITLLIALLCLGGAVGCQAQVIEGDLPEYQYTYNREFVGEMDADMSVDGDLSEERWNNKHYISHTQGDISVKYTTVFTEKGLYIGAVANDPDITYYGRFDMHNNTCFIIYLARVETSSYRLSQQIRIEVDPYDMRSYNQKQFYGAAKLVGEPNSKETVSLTAELFITWDTLGFSEEELIATGGMPEKIKIDPTYHNVSMANGVVNTRGSIRPTNCEPTWMNSYVHFNKDGYVNYDRPGATLGASKTGLSKSDGWDLSKESEGEVMSVRNHPQTLFFRNVASENFVAEATVVPIQGINDAYPQVGLLVMKDRISYRTTFINANSLRDNKSAGFRLMTAYPDDGWYEYSTGVSRTYLAGELIDGLQMKIVKYGTLIMYFLENEFVYSERLSYLDGVCCPALYSLGCQAKYSRYSARELTDAEALSYLKDECDVFVVEKTGNITGGKVNTSHDAVSRGDDITLTIIPDPGFVLTSISNYDESIYEDLRANISGNEYVLKNIQDGVKINATFSRIADTKTTVNVMGEVKSSLSTNSKKIPVAAAKILIRDLNNPLVNYTYETSTVGAYNLSFMPRKGTYNINGVDVTVSGEYEISINADGYRPYTQRISITEDKFISGSGEIVLETNKVTRATNNILLPARNIGGPAFSNEFDFASSTKGWDLTDEENGSVVAHSGSSNQILWFSKGMGRQSIVEFDVENRCLPGTELSPGTGIVIGNKNTKLMAILFGGVVRINPELNWNNGTEYSNTSNFNMASIGEKLHVKFVHDGQTLAIFVHNYDKHSEGEYDLVFEQKFASLDAYSAYGLVITQTKECNVLYSNATVRTVEENGASVKDEIYGMLYGKVSVSGNNDSISSVSISGATAEGYVKKGESVMLSVQTSKPVALKVGNKQYVIAQSGTISIKVTGETKVQVTYPESLVAVSGNILGVDGYNFDLASTEITAIAEGGTEYIFNGVTSVSGQYQISLGAGTYKLKFSNPNFIDKYIPTVTVGTTALALPDARYGALKPQTTVMVAGTTVTGSSNEWTMGENNDITSVTAKRAVGESKYFNVASKNWAIETTFSKLDTSGDEAYPMVGVEVRGKEGYALLIQDHASFSKLDLYLVTTTGSYRALRIGQCSYENGEITMKMVNDNGTLYIFINGQLFRTMQDDGAFFSEGFLSTYATVGVRSVGHRTTFRNIRVVTAPGKVHNECSYRLTVNEVEGGTLSATIDGAPADEYLSANQVITVTATVESGKVLGAIFVNGKAVDFNRTATGGTCEVTVDRDTTVEAYFFEGVTINGKITGVDEYSDIAIRVLGENEAVYSGIVDASGNYSIAVPLGNITIRFEKYGYLPVEKAVTITTETSVNAEFTTPAPETRVTIGSSNFVGSGEQNEWVKTTTGITSGTSGRETRYFQETATAINFSVTINKFDTTKKPFAGITIKSEEREFAFMVYRETAQNGDEKIGFLVTEIVDWSACKWVKGVAVDNATTQSVIRAEITAGSIKVYCNDTLMFSSNGEKSTGANGAEYTDAVYNLSSLVNKEVAIGLIATGTDATFSNISFVAN